MVHVHWIGYPLAVGVGSAVAVSGGASSFVLAMLSDSLAAWGALMISAAGLATAVGGLVRIGLDFLRLKEQLDEAMAKILALEEKAKRDRTTIRRNFSLIKGLMAKMSHSVVMEIVRVQDEKDAREHASAPGQSVVIRPFDVQEPDEAIVPDYDPPSEHDLDIPS